MKIFDTTKYKVIEEEVKATNAILDSNIKLTEDMRLELQANVNNHCNYLENQVVTEDPMMPFPYLHHEAAPILEKARKAKEKLSK